MTDIKGQILLLPFNINLYMLVQLVYLLLTSDHSEGRGHGLAYFDCQYVYLVNGGNYDKRYYCHKYCFKYFISNVDQWSHCDLLWICNQISMVHIDSERMPSEDLSRLTRPSSWSCWCLSVNVCVSQCVRVWVCVCVCVCVCVRVTVCVKVSLYCQ